MSNILFVYGLRSPKRRRLFNHKLNKIKKFDLLAFIRNLLYYTFVVATLDIGTNVPMLTVSV